MTTDPEHRGVDTGRHLLGAHVVGQRVVVRRVLRGQSGPSGGPALTDVLGVCASWADGVCVVVPESGEPVRIAIADIVSGKPVPPRPATRHRVSATEAQTRALALWPDLETQPLGGWLLRRSATSTARRANSVLAMGPPGVEDAYAQVVAFYERPIAAVVPDSAEEELFRSHGWVLESHEADSHFQITSVAQALRAVPPLVEEVALATVSKPPPPDDRPRLVTATIDTRATGIAAYHRDWVGFRGIEVDPAHRREGLAVQVMAALLEWGAEQGATTAYLQVLGDNEPALRLYERLGFSTHHVYRYLAPH